MPRPDRITSHLQRIMRHTLRRLLLIFSMVYVGLGILLTVNQKNYIYYPTPDINVQGVSTRLMQQTGESIRINVLNEGQQKALLYFGGNAEAVAYNAHAFRQVFPDYTIYMMNYRGYGGSSGEPGEEALYADGLALFDMASAGHPDVSIIGRSLGSGIATYIASKRDVSRLVLVTPFDSLVNVAAWHYPVYPVSVMLRDKYDSISRVADIKAKTLVLIANNDRVVGAPHGHKLAAAFPAAQVVKHVLPDDGHNTISSNPQYYALMRDFLSDQKH
ncbi:MAG: alpha/beta hydrolase [Gammaproteobacteria bacterium]|nr:alpha/beta hydrolase [Gammaproteobacteria bacterium]